MRLTLKLARISQVPVRDGVATSALTYYPRYAPPRRMTLSSSFDSVNDKNRFLSLDILLQKLSGYVGRRQYKMSCDLSSHMERFKELGVDLHELKFLQREELMELLNDQLRLTHAEKAILLTALDRKLCGVLCRDTTRHSTRLCMNPGLAEHGWRCGQHGHTNDVYFEGKQQANPAVLQLAHRSAARVARRDGIDVEVRHQPDFSIVGRNTAELHPRIWNAPANTSYVVTPIGFEFRVHPDDPRAQQQIEEAAGEWELHLAVMQQVIAEVLELYAVEREPQPLHLVPGEMGEPDLPEVQSSAFHSRSFAGGTPNSTVVEHRMMDANGQERSWFQAPLPQRFTDGVPQVLPFAPTIILHSSYRHIERDVSSVDVSRRLMQPVVDIACFVHPSACFWWSAEDEEKSTQLILDYARRMPFALPFNLYFRVDPAKFLRAHPEQAEEREHLLSAKASYFDMRHFRTAQKAS
ncbi:putative mitochondrial hypothetical protein [Leptomonas pyrrhocoris]|uniref:Uncharacterized protein n=1 Tax=Leptomonas pyrrhocoris TaxID=157538 RepID=A0A0M9G022_LEPPY|nr:putative mitochondrial hypothetical protein [Leptomonas pyrrhocoris]KPA79396.1 putative mitochondrial hypothetical protein [Leptomonas pyrrhocoris]|eukprot:XP_015657835.1 putative mitochondrial hypothetical protein [Leptomonas pyrrhocoris]